MKFMEWLVKIGRELIAGLLFSTPLAIFITALAFWDDLVSKYITKDSISLSIRPDQIESIAFSYIDQNIIDTILTMFFWSFVGLMILFMIWVLTSTYTSISNVLLINAEFNNKPKHFLVVATKHVLLRVAVSVLSMFSIILIFKLVIPALVSQISINLLGRDISLINYAASAFWIFTLAIALNTIWIIFKEATEYLKSPLE